MLETGGALWWAGLALLGLGVGVVAGMFGVGGGFLLTPLLALVFRVPLPLAVGTGLCQMIGVAAAALLRHRRLGQGEIKIDWMMMAGSLLGVGLGARTVTALGALGNISVLGHTITASHWWLSLGYVILLGGVAVWMARDARRSPTLSLTATPGPLTRVPFPPFTRLPRTSLRVSAPFIGYLGLAMGFLSGLLGVGGGVALMPILLYGFGLPIRTAAGTGILVLLATSIVGTLAHARLGHVHLGMATTMLIGSTLGAHIGASWTARLPAHRLRGLFGAVVALTALAVAWDLLRTLLAG